MPKQGDVVLIPVPFTDLTSQKRRPAIVISNDAYHRSGGDFVMVAMTSNPSQTPYSFTLTSADLVTGSLNRPGTVRVDKIYTLSTSLILKTFGRVNEATLERIRTLMSELTKS